MSNFQSEVFECARNTASIKIDNTEWINEFSGGIELRKGDNVRILGSFVHEGSSGEEMEVASDVNVNVSFTPYIIGSTIGTDDPNDNLLTLGTYADPAYGTDAFGIEPPLRIDTDPETITGLDNYEFPTGNTDAYSVGVATSTATRQEYGLNMTRWQTQGDEAAVYGTNIKTDKFDPTKITDHSLNLNNLDNFYKRSVPNEMYISQIVKKFILPMGGGHINKNGAGGQNGGVDGQIIYDYEPLLDNPVDGEAGMFSGVPKVGMCFATVDVGAISGLFDDDGNGWYENFWGDEATDTHMRDDGSSMSGSCRYNGLPNLKGGVQSLIGSIIAVRPIIHNIDGAAVGCFEIMVTDWVNPASLVKNAMITIEKPKDTLTKVAFAPPFNNPAGFYHKKVHGAGELPNGYNDNPTFNNINGAYNQMSDIGYYSGSTCGVPLTMGYETANYHTNLVGGASENPTKYQKMYGQPTGLSFPWNGSHCGGLRYELPDLTSGFQPYRANSVLNWYNWVGNPDGPCYSMSYIEDVFITDVTGKANSYEGEFAGVGSTPVCYGAYLICNKDTMLKVARGEYDILNDPAGNFYSAGAPGTKPRVWYDFAIQLQQSNYTTRHYVSNSWDTTNLPLGVDIPPQYPLNIPVFTDNRFGYSMCGQPPNINWRNSTPSNGANPSTTGLTHDFMGNGAYPTGMGASVSTLSSTIGDGMPRYWSTPNGKKTWADQDPDPHLWYPYGSPTVWGGYNNCINSIHFQQKETGDTNLGFTNTIARGTVVAAGAVKYNAGGSFPEGIDTIQIVRATLTLEDGTLYVPVEGDYIKIPYDLDGESALMCDAVPIQTVTLTATEVTISLYKPGGFYSTNGHWRLMATLAPLQPVIIFKNSYLGSAAGINAKSWAGDMLMIKEQMVKVEVPTGYYTEDQLASYINDQLHLDTEKYQKKYGVKNADGIYSVPSTVGNKERSLASEPTIVNGNFLHTYIPDISYGFSPITVGQVASDTNLEASTKLMNDEFYTYDSLREGPFGDLIFYYEDTINTQRPYNGIDVRKLSDAGGTIGKHFKLYSIPKLQTSGTYHGQIQLIRLKGGALNIDDYIDPTAIVPPPVPAPVPPTTPGIFIWGQRITRFNGTYEQLRDNAATTTNLPRNPNGDRCQALIMPSNYGIYNTRCRLTRNLLPYGGGCKIFCGANNMSISWLDNANRFSFNNLYTPLRPHQRDDPNNQTQDFSIDDATPSAIINAKHTGAKIGLLTGVYLDNLNAGVFSQEEWGNATVGNDFKYDLVTAEESLIKGQEFLDILGFSAAQVANNSNDFSTNTDPFIYSGPIDTFGNAIRVGPKIDTSINGSNPFASNCLNIAPVAQFFVEVDTDDFIAFNVPSKGIDPYYFIGSDFPTKKFYGNLTGDKLPVMGICARNFHSFNFVFDLGGSSITYTVEEDVTIQSIRTKIYTSSLSSPAQLSPYSSIIYLITRNNTPSTQSIQMPLAQVAAQIIEQNATQNNNMIGQFYTPPLADIRFGQSNLQQPPEFFLGAGIPPPPEPEPDEETDEEDY